DCQTASLSLRGALPIWARGDVGPAGDGTTGNLYWKIHQTYRRLSSRRERVHRYPYLRSYYPFLRYGTGNRSAFRLVAYSRRSSPDRKSTRLNSSHVKSS